MQEILRNRLRLGTNLKLKKQDYTILVILALIIVISNIPQV